MNDTPGSPRRGASEAGGFEAADILPLDLAQTAADPAQDACHWQVRLPGGRAGRVWMTGTAATTSDAGSADWIAEALNRKVLMSGSREQVEEDLLRDGGLQLWADPE